MLSTGLFWALLNGRSRCDIELALSDSVAFGAGSRGLIHASMTLSILSVRCDHVLLELTLSMRLRGAAWALFPVEGLTGETVSFLCGLGV